jgi:hypothetical protein
VEVVHVLHAWHRHHVAAQTGQIHALGSPFEQDVSRFSEECYRARHDEQADARRDDEIDPVPSGRHDRDGGTIAAK